MRMSKHRLLSGPLCSSLLGLAIVSLSATAQTTASNEWTWMGGSSTLPNSGGLPGVYGTLGTPAANNIPGSRYSATTWTDSSGNLWLFGGLGYDSTGLSLVDLNDLWMFNSSTNEWTWISGSSTIYCPTGGNKCGPPGVYGTLGKAAAGNTPGGRDGASGWIDSKGNLWLFGGEFTNQSSGQTDFLNDLWEFNRATNQWAWMGGSNTVPVSASESGQPGVYGTLGAPAAGNIPGGRYEAADWTDKDGNLWLFGGFGTDAKGNIGRLSDLWKFNSATNLWTWMAGYSAFDVFGVYGTLGMPDALNSPGAVSLRSPGPTGTAIFGFLADSASMH